jgi:glycosyltransferase involved in cell wall biosynthesis
VADLIGINPNITFIQLPPTPVLYIVALYCKVSGSKYVADCHNAMLYSSKWFKWPLTKRLLRKADAILVHNEDVRDFAKSLGLTATILRDPLPDIIDDCDINVLEKYGLEQSTYVIVPWSFAPDEPIIELIQVARLMPKIKFVMTWFPERLPLDTRDSMPTNLILTGYLHEKVYNCVFSQAGMALVLTTREGTQPSGASEAIALSVPLIVSDLETTRKLYDDAPIYVDNTVESINTGIVKAFDQRDKFVAQIQTLKNRYGEDINNEIAEVKTLLGLAH